MSQVKQAALKTTILLKGGMERIAPGRVGQITVDLCYGGGIQRPRDLVPLYDSAAGDQRRVVITHAILVRHGAHQWCQPKRHVIPEMNRVVL